MISWLTILLFFLYLWGLGFTALYFLKNPEHTGERHLLYLGMGLGVFPILAILLNFLHLPLDWKLFLALSFFFPTYVFSRKLLKKEFKLPSLQFKLTKSSLFLLVALLIFAFSLFMYAKGAFAYPYLEDEDPWGHSVGIKYVALEKNAYDPKLSIGNDNTIDPVLSYIDPYPPAYDILMGILHQTSPDLQWTMKFFNALIISLGILFFYLFAHEFMRSKGKALLATFFLAAVPAYLSHFIWAHALAITLFFPTMYAFLKIRDDRRWTYLALILVSSIWVSQNVEQPLKATVMILIFIVVGIVVSRKGWKAGKPHFGALGGGILLSFLWWGAMIQKYSLKGFVRYYTGERIFSSETIAFIPDSASASGLFDKLLAFSRSLRSAGGSGSRAYTWDDFVIAKSQNMINNPIGIGLILSLLVLTGLVYVLWKYRSSLVEEKNLWLCVTLFWLIFTFWGVNGQTFPVSIMRGPFRMWMWLAIPVALLAAEMSFVFKDYFYRWKIPKVIVLGLLMMGVIVTSFVPKYQANTSIWPTSGSFTSPQEPWEYGAWFRSIPINSKVFLYAPRDKIAIGYGAFACAWCDDEINFRGTILEQDALQLHSFLKSKGYEYLIINGNMDAKYFKGQFDENETSTLLPQRYQEIQSPELFTPVHYKENMFLVLKVN